MTKIKKSKGREGRTLLLNIWGSEGASVKAKNYYPGQHGATLVRRNSDYAVQLKAKQALKWHYGYISERYFRNLARKAKELKGDSVENLICMLESRLDSIIYRANFAPTIFAARQLVSHGNVLVNGKKVDISSCQIKIGSIVSLNEKAKQFKIVDDAISSETRAIPSYLEVNKLEYTAKLIIKPVFSSVPYGCVMNPYFVIEYYSR